MILEARGWRFAQYRWNDTETAATLINGGEVTLSITEADGTTTSFTHLYPSRSDCQRCHNASSGEALGPRTVQMNRSFDFEGVTDNQLRAYEHAGMFSAPLPGSWETLPRMAAPTDTIAPLADRARAYLEGNCAHCHHPGGPTAAEIDLR